MADTIYASFADAEQAEKAAGALLDYGARNEDISLISRNAQGRQTTSDARGHAITEAALTGGAGNEKDAQAKEGITTTTPEDAGAGAVKGTGIGLGVGALAALAALFVPGVGLVVGGGALASALGGAALAAGAGAVAGGVAGYLKDQGVPAQYASRYNAHVENGGALLSLHVPSGSLEEPLAREALNKYGAQNLGNSRQGGTFEPYPDTYDVSARPAGTGFIGGTPDRADNLETVAALDDDEIPAGTILNSR